MTRQNEKTIQDLKLEIQELRQFCLTLIRHIPVTREGALFANGGLTMSQDIKDHWWEKLGNHAPVEVNEKAMDCCSMRKLQDGKEIR